MTLLLSVTFSWSSVFIPSLSRRKSSCSHGFRNSFPQKMRLKTMGCYLDVHPSGWKMVGFLSHFWSHEGHPGPASITISRITLRFLSWSPVSVRLCTSLGAGKVRSTPRMSWCKSLFCNWLVVSTYPSEKYESQLGWWHSQLNGKIIKFHGSSHHQSGKRALDMCFYNCGVLLPFKSPCFVQLDYIMFDMFWFKQI